MSYIGNTQQNQSYVPAVDFFSGDGSTTAFTLSKPVATTAQIQAVISNVPQTPGVAYTVSGSTITFTSAPPSGTNNIYVYYTSPNTQVMQPGQGTVGTTQVADGTITPAKLSTGVPSWDASGNVTLTGNLILNNGAADGAQAVLKSVGYDDWNVDNYSGSLRFYNGSTVRASIDSSGRVTMPYQPAFFAGLSSHLATGYTGTIIFDSTRFNVGGHYNTSNGRFTAPVAGRYLLTVNLLAQGDISQIDISIQLNGSNVNNFRLYSADSQFGGCVIINLAVNDYVTVSKNYTGRNAYGDHNWTNFSGFLIG